MDEAEPEGTCSVVEWSAGHRQNHLRYAGVQESGIQCGGAERERQAKHVGSARVASGQCEHPVVVNGSGHKQRAGVRPTG